MPRFVLSYARLDGKDLVARFFRDLNNEVVRSCGDDPNYFDQIIELGDEWPASLTNALRTGRVLLPLYSHNFFTSEHCAREVQVFKLRRRLVAGDDAPKSILPVLWMPKRYEIPADVEDIQYTMGGLPAEYEKYGIARLLQQKDLEDKYNQVLFALADLIQDAMKQNLPPLAVLDYRSVDPAWRIGEIPLATRPPAYYVAQFIYACAQGRDWAAFHPPSQKPIGILAMEASAAEQFHYEYVPLDGQLSDRIDAAARNKALVVLIVEPAAARAYEAILSSFDRINFRNCSVLIPVNDQDESLRTRTTELLADLREILHFRSQFSGDAPYFRFISGTEQSFSQGIRQVLTSLRSGQTKVSRSAVIDPGPSRSALPTF